MILSDNHISRQFKLIFTNFYKSIRITRNLYLSHIFFRPSWRGGGGRGGREILISHIPEWRLKNSSVVEEIPPHFRPVTGKNWTLIENWLHRKNITNEEAISPPLPSPPPAPRRGNHRAYEASRKIRYSFIHPFSKKIILVVSKSRKPLFSHPSPAPDR